MKLKSQTGQYARPPLQAGPHYNPLFPILPLQAVRWQALYLSMRLPRRGALKEEGQVCRHAVVKCPNFRGQHNAQANECTRRKPCGPLEGGGLRLYCRSTGSPATEEAAEGARMEGDGLSPQGGDSRMEE